ncbi:hypothetical protein ABPG72_008347 [Tetrahymena utriculariae]
MAERIGLTEAAQIEIDEINLISYSYHQTVQKLREWKLLQKEEDFICESEMCEAYNEQMSWQKDSSRNDLGRFVCYSCQTKRSVRSNSLFITTNQILYNFSELFLKALSKEKEQASLLKNKKLNSIQSLAYLK